MIHEMRLNNEPFNKIKEGTKTVELRLLDEKRKTLRVGDKIIFTNRANNEKIDVLKTISMLLIHDLVEIDAGDTYAYDDQGLKTQNERENLAANRIFNLLPEDQAKKIFDLWNEFEERKTPEAKFARVMDNFQPVMLNAATDGRMWVENGVHLEKILKRNEKTHEGSEVLWKYMYEHFILPNVKKGRIKE